MPIHAGTRLGSYEIVSLLGVGGMGEVYRARDARLQRDVALKVLPDIAASDPDRRERFTREALAVAALNHPHIVTIHSVEDAGTTVFLTMELVEGRSLAEALPMGGLPLDRVLTVGIAVADALSASHQKGITHRDLKPANIMLGEGDQAGRIKVLDFGLAKLAESQGSAPLASMVQTGDPAGITAEGRIVGTVAYMSPEQAEGRAVDGRSDLFSLGVVLYEVATGRRPFMGDTNLSILSSILKDTPRSVTDINSALPSEFGRIVRRALAKDPERRYQSAKDLRNDLDDLKAALDAGELAMPPTARPAAVAQSDSSVPRVGPASSSDAQLALSLARRHSWTLAVVVVLIVGVAAAMVMLLRREDGPRSSSEAPTALPSLANLQITQLTTSGNAERPAISPDGRYVVYVQRDSGGHSLWIRQTTTTSNGQIVSPERGVSLLGATFTPDGTSIDFVRQSTGTPAEIWRIPFLGGTPRLLISDVSSSLGWSPDGGRVAFLRSRLVPTLTIQLIVAAADGGQELALASSVADTPIISLIAPWYPNISPAWSPDGQMIAVAAANITTNGGRVLFVNSQSGSTQEVTVPSGNISGLTWLDARSLVINQSPQVGAPSQLFRLPYPKGPLSRITNDPNDYLGTSLSLDRNVLVANRRDARMDVWVGDGGATSGVDVVQRVPISVAGLVWSGDQLLYGAFIGGRPAILRTTPGQCSEEVVADALSPGVTGDGRTIVFVSSSSADNNLNLWTADANGRRIAQLASSVTAQQVMVTPDDRSVLFVSLTSGTASIWIVPIAGGTPAKLTDGGNAAVSPDGGAIAFSAERADGRPILAVCNLPGCNAPRTIGPASFDSGIAWTPDGRGVAFVREGNLWVQPIAGGAPRQLTHFTDNHTIGAFAWSRDGTRLAIARATMSNDIVLFKGLQ